MAPAALTDVSREETITDKAQSFTLPAKEKPLNLPESSDEQRELLRGLSASPKQIPCSFLYDSVGTALYNQITDLDEYYPYRAEVQMLSEVADDVISHIPTGAIVVELGCGSATKTAILQRALLSRDGPDACTFLGIDVSRDFLDQAKANLLEACPDLLPNKVELVQATYMEGLRAAREMHPKDVLCVLWLGSSAGNMSPEESVAFFKDALQICGQNTEILVCTDLWKDKAALHAAYCDSKGVTEAFIKNGMANALSVATHGRVQIKQDQWIYDVVVNAQAKQVEMYLIAGESVVIDRAISIRKGERLLIEVSRKFTTEQLRALAFKSGFYFQAQWRSPQYSIQMLCAPALALQLAWRDTDELFSKIREWHETPIELRHPFCFYYGHVCSFAKLRLVEEDASKVDITFSRGIDPNVADPSQCHSHPAAPEEWPSKEAIINYVQQMRQKMLASVHAGTPRMQMICMCLEHEWMHKETLCYMMAQQQKRQWEAAHILTDGNVLENGAFFKESMAKWSGGILDGLPESKLANGHSEGHDWSEIKAGKVALGVHTNGESGYVWDNEGPLQDTEEVNGFTVASQPVSIAEYQKFVLEADAYADASLWDPQAFGVLKSAKQTCPTTWTITADKDVWVHYPEGTWNWLDVKDRPVWCSLAEATAYCNWKRCRIMTEAEYELAMKANAAGSKVEMLQCGGWEWISSPFAPFKGFKADKEYEEYSNDFFDGEHFVLKGGSPYTHSSVQRPSFRNFYQGIYPHMFAKFRCCKA